MAILTASRTTAPPRPVARRRPRRRVPPVLLAFLLVPLAVEGFWVFWPALQGFWLSLTNWDGVSAPAFVGLGNFGELAGDPIFRGAALNTAIWLVLFGGLSAVGGLGMAVLLQQERRGVGFYRAALFVPVVFSLVATSLIWQVLYQPGGIFDSSPLADPDTAIYAVLVPALWRQ